MPGLKNNLNFRDELVDAETSIRAQVRSGIENVTPSRPDPAPCLARGNPTPQADNPRIHIEWWCYSRPDTPPHIACNVCLCVWQFWVHRAAALVCARVPP